MGVPCFYLDISKTLEGCCVRLFFVAMLGGATLLHRRCASAGMSLNCCADHDSIIRNTVY